MPYVSDRDRRQMLQTMTPITEDPGVSTFGEVFGASVGLVIDENMSISSALNREGWSERKRLVREKVASGEINADDYTDHKGTFDYNRFAIDAEDPAIKTTAQLVEDRNEMLKKRRDYAQDVIDRGNGIAQFLGMANAYVLDPINIATMPVATAATGVKSLSIAGRALMVGRNEAALAVASELAIQPLVYAHRMDIESPFTMADAITNIAGAAAGSAIIGGTTGAISGYLKKVMGETEDLVDPSVIENLQRLHDTVEQAPDSSIEGQATFLRELEEQRIVSGAPSKTPEQYAVPERAVPRSATVTKKIVEPEAVEAAKAEPAIKPKVEKEVEPAKAEAPGAKPEPIEIPRSKYIIKGGIVDDKATKANLPNVPTGHTRIFRAHSDTVKFSDVWDAEDLLEFKPPKGVDGEFYTDDILYADYFRQTYSDPFGQGAKVSYIDVPANQLVGKEVKDGFWLDVKALKAGEVSRKIEAPSKPKVVTTSNNRQAELLNAAGLKRDYDADIDAYDQLAAKLAVVDGEVVNANPIMKQLNEDIDGLESVLVCSRG